MTAKTQKADSIHNALSLALCTYRHTESLRTIYGWLVGAALNHLKASYDSVPEEQRRKFLFGDDYVDRCDQADRLMRKFHSREISSRRYILNVLHIFYTSTTDHTWTRYNFQAFADEMEYFSRHATEDNYNDSALALQLSRARKKQQLC